MVNVGIELLFQNVGMSWEYFLALLVFVGGLLFYVKSYRLGTVLHFFMFSVLFIITYQIDQNSATSYNWGIPLIGTLIFLIMMVMTMIMESRPQASEVV